MILDMTSNTEKHKEWTENRRFYENTGGKRERYFE